MRPAEAPALPHAILRPPAADLPAPRQEVMRLLGYREGRTRLAERDLALVDEGIRLAQAASAPAASLAYCAVAAEGDRVRTGLPGVGWRSRSLARLLAGAEGISLVAATLGPGVEELTRELFGREEYALATIVDAAGSVLIHGLGEWVRAWLADGSATGPVYPNDRSTAAAAWPEPASAGPEPAAKRPQLTPLYGPGYGDWPVADQAALLDLAGGADIGLTSTAACYLQPQKSLVGLIGWLPPRGGRTWPAAGCTRCTWADCAYRVRPGGW